MIGLYLLTTNVLEKLQTIKFGMSMRIEYRWIDYLQIFNDAKYVYYYELPKDMTKEAILNIESEIIKLHQLERNPSFNNKQPSVIIEELCKSDKKFPPDDLFLEYYKVPINELIVKINKPKLVKLKT